MKTNKRNAGVVVAMVPSDSNPNRMYTVRRTDSGLVCGCMAFRFAVGAIGSRGKTCKHLKRLVAA